MDCHRPKGAWWLCTGCADVCATPASLLLIANLARLGDAGHQLDIFVFGDGSELPGQKPVTLTLFLFLFLLCSHLLYLRAWALCCYGPECLRCESHFSCRKYREESSLSSAHVERVEPHSNVVKSTVQEAPKTRQWHTCQKHNQSSVRTFCLSRHINQAQIDQLWLCKIFLIQPFRWLSSIGKSLNGKKGQKGILLPCLLKTT